QGLPARELRGQLGFDEELVRPAFEELQRGCRIRLVLIHVFACRADGIWSGRPARRFLLESETFPGGRMPDGADHSPILAQRPQSAPTRPWLRLGAGQWSAVAILALSGVAAFGIAPESTLDAPAGRTVV